MRLRRDRDVLQRREPGQHGGDLERARQAEPAADMHRQAVTSPPAKRMRPASGAICPHTCPIRVVLPAPFGPIRAWIAPSSTAIDRPSVTVSAPYDLRSPSRTRIGSAHAVPPPNQPDEAAARTPHDQDKQDRKSTRRKSS